MGCGVDLVHLPRFYKFLLKYSARRLLLRISSDTELNAYTASHASCYDKPLVGGDYCTALPEHQRVTMFLAKLWSIKEASFKAISPICMLNWKDAVVSSEGGKPVLSIDGSTRRILDEKYDNLSTHVSVSHTEDYLISQVIMEGILQSYPESSSRYRLPHDRRSFSSSPSIGLTSGSKGTDGGLTVALDGK